MAEISPAITDRHRSDGEYVPPEDFEVGMVYDSPNITARYLDTLPEDEAGAQAAGRAKATAMGCKFIKVSIHYVGRKVRCARDDPEGEQAPWGPFMKWIRLPLWIVYVEKPL